MKKKLSAFFGFTEEGMKNIFVAARFSFLKFLTYVFTPMLVFAFLMDYTKDKIKPTYVYMGILAVIFVVSFLIMLKEYVLQYDVTFKESANLRIAIANKLKSLPLSYFSKHDLTDLSQTVMMDVSNAEIAISHSLPPGIGFLLFFFVMTILLIITQPLLGLSATLPIWGAIWVMFLSRKKLRKNVTVYYNKMLDNSAAFQEAFEMQEEIKSYSLRDEVDKEVSKKLEDTEKRHLKAEFGMGFLSTLIGFLPLLAPVLVAVVGAVLFNSGKIDILYYAGYLMAATTLSSQYASINEYIVMIIFFEDSFERIRNLRSEPVQEGRDEKIDSFDISLKNVGFGYSDNKVIKGATFTAKQGEVTALVGPSGCGKTTILRLISRLYDYDSGEITIGGKEIKGISVNSLYDNISIVFQNVDLFDTSILENIRLGRKDATDEEVIEAAKLANVDEIAARLPEGYDTQIGENGAKLSGGERQRISIARAILKNAPIILLDEIAASLDVENEYKIQQSLNRLIKDKTVMIISHRLRSIRNVDKIVLLNDGNVEMAGKHEELMESSALYRRLIERSGLTEAYKY